jgi:peptidoglycan/LPS O-acetylase OafA/YrhL
MGTEDIADAISMTRTHLPERNLDVLRAIAVSCVVADHLMWACGRQLPFMTDWELGRIGVLLFFVHTSLVLMSSMERSGVKRHWVRDFYTRRAFRIYPLAMAAVLITVLFHIPSIVPAAFIPPAPRTILTNLLLVQNVSGDTNIMGMLWSLPVEVQMYVVLPALFLLAQRSVVRVAGAFCIAAVLALAVQYAPVPALWRLSVALFGPCFVSGVLAFAILRAAPRFKLPAWTWIPLLIAAIPLFVVFNPSPTRSEPGWLFCLAVGIAISFVTELKQSRFTSVAKTICTYSYGVYLMVTPAIWIGFVVLKDQPRAFQWIAFAAGLVALPWAAYTFIEHPAIVMGRNLVSARQSIAETAPAP